jgi:hypothetical protein
MHPWIGLSDDVRLGVLTEWVPPGLVDQMLADCGKWDRRPGALPARFTVYYTLALALFQQDSYDDVAEDLVGQVKTFQRGPQEVLRSAGPELVRQEVWAHLTVHHCLSRIIMRLAEGERIDPDHISFTKVLKHVRRSVIRQCAQTSVQIKQFLETMAAKVRRKHDNGTRRLRQGDRLLKRPASKYSYRKAGQIRSPTRRVAPRQLALRPTVAA